MSAAQVALFAAAIVAPTAPLWTRIDERPWTKTNARWLHRDGWRLEHCGHPTALTPWLLTSPDGLVILTGAHHSGDPSHGTAWPNLRQAFDYVAFVTRAKDGAR